MTPTAMSCFTSVVGRYRQVVGGGVLTLDRLARRRVGAHPERADRYLALPCPLFERLRHQGDRRREEEHGLAGAGVFLSDPQHSEGLARAARHNQLAAVRVSEPGSDGVDGLELVRSEHVGGWARGPWGS